MRQGEEGKMAGGGSATKPKPMGEVTSYKGGRKGGDNAHGGGYKGGRKGGVDG